jgi:ABC-type xylose transport system permease subunit
MSQAAGVRMQMPWWRRFDAGSAGVLVLIAAVCLVGAVVSDRFLSLNNFLNVFEQTTDLALVSIGQTLTILSGGIDLSVGSLISLTSCLTSGLINNDPDRVGPVVIGVLMLGTLVGFLNAALVVALRVHPLIVTLGMGAILQGVTLLYALGPVGRVPRSFNFLAYGRLPSCSASSLLSCCDICRSGGRYLRLATMPIRRGWLGCDGRTFSCLSMDVRDSVARRPAFIWRRGSAADSPIPASTTRSPRSPRWCWGAPC